VASQRTTEHRGDVGVVVDDEDAGLVFQALSLGGGFTIVADAAAAVKATRLG
jgi:hypothetical protein